MVQRTRCIIVFEHVVALADAGARANTQGCCAALVGVRRFQDDHDVMFLRSA